MNEQKKIVILKPCENTPMLELTAALNTKEFDHLLRREDRENVLDIVTFLTLRDHQVYITGEAVENWMFRGQRDYTNISLVGVAPNEGDRLQQAAKELLNAAQLGMVWGRGLRVTRKSPSGINPYTHTIVDERFILSPSQYYRHDDKIYGFPIDLSLVSRKNFDEALRN